MHRVPIVEDQIRQARGDEEEPGGLREHEEEEADALLEVGRRLAARFGGSRAYPGDVQPVFRHSARF